MIRLNSVPVRWQHTTKAALLPAVLLLFAAGNAFAAVQYAITDLGTLGGTYSYAYGINDSGQVVGTAYTTSVDGAEYYQHAFLYSGNGPMQDLGTLPGGTWSYASGINNSGQIVGGAQTPTTAAHAFLYNGSGPMQDLGTLSGGTYDSFANAINNSGQVVGRSDWYSPGGTQTHAFLYSGSGPMQDLTTSIGRDRAYGINDSGQVVGSAWNDQGDSYAFRTSPNSPINPATDNLGTLGGSVSGANGINNSGQVVGFAYTSIGSYNHHAFLYSGSGPMQDLGTLGTYINYNNVPIERSVAHGINNSGQVVGEAMTSSAAFHAFLYSGSGPMQDLNNLIVPTSGLTLTRANAINDKGQIVGSGTNPAGQTRAFLLSPLATVPSEPGGGLILQRGSGGSLDPKPVEKDKLVLVTHGWDRYGNGPTGLDEFVDSIKTAIPSSSVGWDVQKHLWTKGNAKGSIEGATTGSLNPFSALGNAWQEGAWLGEQLFSQGWQEVHLIGHSAGAGLVQAAVEKIKELDQKNNRQTVVHATFLDAFNGITGSGKQKYGKEADWADNYFAYDEETQEIANWTTGGKYLNAHNVDITWLDPEKTLYTDQSGNLLAVSRHIWPYEWYSSDDSIYGRNDGYGFHLSREAGGWEEALGHLPNNDPVVLDHTDIPQNPGYLCRQDAPRNFENLAGTASLAMSSTVQLDGTKIMLPTASPAWISSLVETDLPVNFVSFTVDFTSELGAEGLLSVYWGADLLGSIDERFVLEGIQEYAFALSETFLPGSYVLGFRLDPFTTTQSVAEIDQVATGFASVPEPSTFVLLSVGAISLLAYAWRRRKWAVMGVPFSVCPRLC